MSNHKREIFIKVYATIQNLSDNITKQCKQLRLTLLVCTTSKENCASENATK
jgi:hypothetical protein